MKEAFQHEYPEAAVIAVPMADGGEGTMEAIVSAMNGSVRYVTARGPLFETRQAAYGVVGDTVIIEVAQVIGLPLVPNEKRHPLHTTTYGVGEIIAAALHAGYRRFVIGLGGSSTNDGGFGMLCALGATFTNEKGSYCRPCLLLCHILPMSIWHRLIDAYMKANFLSLAMSIIHFMVSEEHRTYSDHKRGRIVKRSAH